jgi:hypothetical protein
MPTFLTPPGVSEVWAVAAQKYWDDYDKVGWRSVTTLCDAPRIQLLRERHDDAFEIELEDYIAMLEGNVTHDILCRAGESIESTLVEERIVFQFCGREISMKPDRVSKIKGTNPAMFRITDYKRCKAWAYIFGGSSSWSKQLNIYRLGLYLTQQMNVTQLVVEARFSDWNRLEAKTKRDYPPQPVLPMPQELWDLDTTKEYLKKRIELYEAVENLPDNELPRCTEHERWCRQPDYAIMKKGAKKAYRCFPTREEAEKMLKRMSKPTEYDLVYRPGESVRCGYCECRPFCNQYLTEINPAF